MIIMHSTVLKQINAAACEMIDKPMPTLSEWAFDEFYRNGNRINYENLYFERRKMLAVYGLKAMTEGEKVEAETLDKLNYVLFEILSEDTWALPAHVNKYSDPDWERTVDLFACETASAIGLIYRYAGAFLPAFLKDCMVKEVKNRVLNPFFKEGKSFGWEGCHHNWNAVCTGGIGIALLTLGQEAGFSEKEKAEGIIRIKKSLRTYLNNAFSPDGVSLEGVGYFNYGMSFYMAFATELMNEGDDELLGADDAVKKRLWQLADFINAIYLKNGFCVNFSDAKAGDKILPGIAVGFKYAGIELELRDEAYADFNTDPCYRFAGLWLGIFVTEGRFSLSQNVTMRNVPLSHFKDAEWAVYQSENGAAFAIKGGHNGEPHNHNDVGGFIYYVGDRCLACDLGAGEYTADYFGAARYNYLCCSSSGHSVPVVAGQYQEAGENHRTSYFRVKEEDYTITVTLEYHDAYPKGTCVYLERRAVFNLKTGLLTIEDRCDQQFVSVLVSQTEPDIQVTCGQAMEPSDHIFSNHEGKEENVRLYLVDAKETRDAVFTDGNSGRRLFRTTYSLSAGVL